jgi:hypothetical protein
MAGFVTSVYRVYRSLLRNPLYRLAPNVGKPLEYAFIVEVFVHSIVTNDGRRSSFKTL